MTTTRIPTAADRYAAQVDAVLTQRTRLRGEPPAGDLFAGLMSNSPLLSADPHRPTYPHVKAVAAFLEPDDVLLDVGGGAGRISLPLALRCREAVNVDPSAAMTAAFLANAERAGVTNVRALGGDWLTADPPIADVALVAHVLYLTRDIRPFIEKLEAAVRRRVVLIVGAPPPPTRSRSLFALVHGEEEALVPGHEALLAVLWEMGILPDVRVLPLPSAFPPSGTREEAITQAVGIFSADQWALWPLGKALERRLRRVLDQRFADFFLQTPAGFQPGWMPALHEVLITWEPRSRAPAHTSA